MENQDPVKTCSECKQAKNVEHDFYYCATNLDRRENICTACKIKKAKHRYNVKVGKIPEAEQ